MLLVAALSCTSVAAEAQGPSQGPPPGASGFEVTARDANTLELRFHNMPFKGVHADASQNALSIDFLGAVDGSAFDRLAANTPDWIAMAYANYDTAVIRASRPVTFLTRKEADGFSLRMVARGPAPMPPPGPVALRGGYAGDGGPPPPLPYDQPLPVGAPPPDAFARYDSYGAIRGYDMLELAVNRANPVWRKAYDRAALQGDSEFSFGTEYHSYRNGDKVLASTAHAKVTLADGVSLIGSLDDSKVNADQTREPNGGFAFDTHANRFSGSAGLAFDYAGDTEITLEALEGNTVTGGRFTGYSGDPNSFWQLNLTYHKSDLDTPEAIAARGFKDEAVLATGQHLGFGLWGGLGGHFTNYGIHDDASVAKTLGWDANLRWSTDFYGLLAGLSYDGRGDYRLDHANFTGAAPSPYVPLSIRNMETHAVTGSLSSLLWGDTLWLDLYGGYIDDRYASNGGIYGAALRYRPEPGVDIALGARHTAVSMTQGELGSETSAGLTFTLGFNGLSRFNYF